MDKTKVVIKIEPYGEGYTARRPDWNGFYHKEGRLLRGDRSLLYYVQSMSKQHTLDISGIPDSSLKSKLVEIINGEKTVTDEDWKTTPVHPA